jgi:pimeloyl-ACP methyl ester carboxylesterase
MNRRQLLAAALAPLALRVAPDALSSTAFAAASERDGKMSKTTQRIVECNGIHINIAEQGEGPLVLLVHGFPESWFSWRHQIDALAAAGFRVVAPDMRGYGKSDAPRAIDQYTILHLVGDMVGILDALGAATAVIVGHDWGASVAGGPRSAARQWRRSACRSGRAARRRRPA